MDIRVEYAIRLTRLLYELKPRADRDWVLIFRALRVELTVPLYLELWLGVNKARYPVLTNRLRGRILAARDK